MKTTLNDALEDSIVNDAAPVRFTWPLSDKELFRELHEFWDGDYGYDISGDDIEIHGWDDDGASAFRVIANVSRHL